MIIQVDFQQQSGRFSVEKDQGKMRKWYENSHGSQPSCIPASRRHGCSVQTRKKMRASDALFTLLSKLLSAKQSKKETETSTKIYFSHSTSA